VLSGCSAKDWERDLRWGNPTGVTDQATRIRVLFTWAGVAALVLGIIVWGLIFWSCIVYRKRKNTAPDDLPRQTKYNLVIELTCLFVPFAVVLILFWRTVVVEDDVNSLSHDPDVVVQVDAFKWNWEFDYHQFRNASGQVVQASYGSEKNPRLRDQPLYLSTVGSDNEIPILVIPVGQNVQFIEHSFDVIHSFWVPEFLFKRDVIPYGDEQGNTSPHLADNRFQVTPTTRGAFVGRCAELCGTYHSEMNFEVRVVTPSVFRAYLNALVKIGPDDPNRQSKALTMAKVPGGPRAVTTHPFATSRTAHSAVNYKGSG
jgi:cytochrome c oxidase subunit 2